MHTITIRNKKKCRPVTLLSISKTTANNTLIVEWSNPYNMSGAVTLQYSIDNGLTYYNVQQLDVTSNIETVYSSALGNIPNGQVTLFRLVINNNLCGDIASNTIQVTYTRDPIVLFEGTGTYYLDYIQNTYKYYRIAMAPAFIDVISETGTYKFDFEINKSQQVNNQLPTIYKLVRNVSPSQSFPTLVDPPSNQGITDLANIPQPVGNSSGTVTLDLQAGTKLTLLFYQYNGGFMRLSTSVKIKVTKL